MYLSNKISLYFGKFAKKKFSKKIQSFINETYVKMLGLDMSEFNPPSSYESLNDLFTRELKTPREFDKSKNNFVSPADSFVTECGKIEKGKAYQIKGKNYLIDNLLTHYISKKNISLLEYFANFYLSPKDYHRYHMPYSAKILKAIYVPGKLLPVNIPALNYVDNLFIENERVILECISDDRYFYMVFVGALNVGKMEFLFDKNIKTNSFSNMIKVYEYENLSINKGECLGYFELGSTILLFWEKDFISLDDILNKKIKFGDKIADVL